MLKLTPIFLFFLLSFSHYITCDKRDDYVKRTISYLSQYTGSCSEYFQYLRIDDFINGKLTLPHLAIGDTVKMTFYQLISDLTPLRSIDGIFLPDGSSKDVVSRLQKKQLISYRVDFPVRFRVPELIKIFINGNEICETRFGKLGRSSSSYKILTFQHTLNVMNESLPVFTYNIHIPHFAESPTPHSAETPTCGVVDAEIQNHGVLQLVYGGKVTHRGEYPWLTAIYKKPSTGLSFLCGGSLVTSNIILSAAHCFLGLSSTPEKIIAMLGHYNLTNYEEDGFTIREIEAVILHPDYQPGLGFSDSDLAVIEMKNHVSFTKYIKPVCLWNEPAEESRIVNQTGVVVGWGSDENGNSITVAPKKVNVKIVSGEECLRSSLGFHAITSSRTLCAGNRDGAGPCEGDSGGGLILNRNGIWMLRGIISLALTVGQRCDLQEFTVYCDVAKHMSWVQNYTKQQDPPVASPLQDICGKSDTESRIGQPWLAAVYRKYATGELFYCTGSIVSARSVLVTALLRSSSELFDSPPNTFRVYLGRYDLYNINENGVISREVATVIVHPDFKLLERKVLDNNIALLQLKDPVRQYVKPICLWTGPMDQSQIVGQSVTFAGWEQSEVRRHLQKVPSSIELNISSLEECRELDYNVSTSSRVLCITGLVRKKDGILILKRNGRWLLRGISLWSTDYVPIAEDSCLFADIAKYASWIQSNMLS